MKEFYVKKFHFENNFDSLNLDFIPSILKRRLSVLDKITISNLKNVFDNNVENIIFASQYGEVERLLKLINQYLADKEVSPGIFSSSVHNFPVGFFLFNIKRTIPYNAISAHDNTISAGLLTALASNYKNIIYCYSDANDGLNSFALNITKNKCNYPKYRIIKEFNNVNDNYENYIRFFNNEINAINALNFKLQRCI